LDQKCSKELKKREKEIQEERPDDYRRHLEEEAKTKERKKEYNRQQPNPGKGEPTQ